MSLFNLRPRRTAVVITVLTGSLISALSFGALLLVSRQLRVGLFELNDLQSKLKDRRIGLEANRKRIIAGEKELKQLEKNLISLRRGNVVLSSGQILVTATLKLENPTQSK